MLFRRSFTAGVSGSSVDTTRGADHEKAMLLLYVDVIEGHTPAEIRALLDAVHADITAEADRILNRTNSF
jgi:hypothetical protein